MIPAKEIGYILRSLGQNPTEDDIIALVCEAGCDWEGDLTADDFLAVALVAMQKQVDRMDDVKAAFRSVSEYNNTHYKCTVDSQSCEPNDWAITGSDIIPIPTMTSYLYQR